MNIAIEELSTCRRRLSIEIPSHDVEEESRRILDDFQKYASIKGFRPGKAPRKMIETKYRREIESEVKRTLVPKAFREAVKQKELNIVSSPNVEDLQYKPGLSLSFTTTVDLAPEFTLPNYKGIEVKKVPREITDEEVQKTVSGLLEQHAHYVDVIDRGVETGDFAVISYTGTVDGQTIASLAPEFPQLEKQEKFWLWIKEDIFLPGFGSQLVGKQPGGSYAVQVTFPSDFPAEPLRGKTASYEVQLEQIKQKVLPELNDELAQQIGGMKADELLDIIRRNMTRQKENEARSEELRQIFQFLQNSVNFELPESSVTEETRHVISDILEENHQRGVPDHVLEENKGDIITNAEKAAKDRVKLNFILSSIARAEKIEISGQDMSQELTQLAHRMQMPVDKLYRRLEENGAILRVQDDVRRRKTIDFLLQSASIR
ncbi:MAG: trigger factor [Candidatus Methylacidiphilales bacterium]